MDSNTGAMHYDTGSLTGVAACHSQELRRTRNKRKVECLACRRIMHQSLADRLDRMQGDLDDLYDEANDLEDVVARAVHDACEALVRARALAYGEATK